MAPVNVSETQAESLGSSGRVGVEERDLPGPAAGQVLLARGVPEQHRSSCNVYVKNARDPPAVIQPERMFREAICKACNMQDKAFGLGFRNVHRNHGHLGGVSVQS